MAMLCVVLPDGGTRRSASPQTRTLRISKIGSDEEKTWSRVHRDERLVKRIYAKAERRYHTAMIEDEEGAAYTRPQSTSRLICDNALEQASVLVTELLEHILVPPPPYGTSAPPYQDDDLPPPYESIEETARPKTKTNLSEPFELISRETKTQSTCTRTMNHNIDFGSTAGFQTRGKKASKKAAQKAQQSKWADDDDDKKESEGVEDNLGAGGDGGDAGGGAGGAGGDENGGGDGGGDEGDEWAFGNTKKTKKKTKKQQQEEDEEEQRKKDEEEAANVVVSNADPLSWADETNDNAGNDDWTTGFATKKDKKKKKKGADDDANSAVPDAPPTSAFQDISLDDASPKLDFSFDSGETKKDTGFGKWGTTWGFGSADKGDEKKSKDKDTKESSTTFGDNNPWPLGGSKNKTKTGASDFDFGDFGATDEISFDNNDLADTKAADDAWGFSGANKKDKKKKEDPIPEPDNSKEESSWGTWGVTGKKDKKGKKEVIEDELPPAAPDPPPAVDEWSSFGFGKKDKKKGKKEVEDIVPEPEPEAEPVDSFDWGFGSKKTKTKSLISEVKDDLPAEPTTEPAGDNDWLGSGWGASTKKNDKKIKKGTIEDLSASIDLGSAVDTKSETPADDPWAFTSTKKDKKKGKKDDIPPVALEAPTDEEADIWSTFDKKGKKSKVVSPEPDTIEEEINLDPEPEATLDPVEEALPWDHGLSARDKKKKEKEMTKQNLWPFGDIGKPEPKPEPLAVAFEAELEPAVDPVEDVKPWDFGLNSKDKKKKEKEMTKKNLWPFGTIGKPAEPEAIVEAVEVEPEADFIPEPEQEPEPEPEPFQEDAPAWDFGLTAKEKKKKEKEMTKNNMWPFGDIGKPKVQPEPEPELEPVPAPAPEHDTIPEPEIEADKEEEEAVPWDFGLSAKEKKKKEKEMTKQNLWPFGDIGKPAAPEVVLEPEPEPEPEPEAEAEPEPMAEEEALPWDFGLSAKEKKKKEKEMKKNNQWPFGDIGKPADPEPAPVIEPEVVPDPEPEHDIEVKEDNTWGTWGAPAKDKKKKDKETKSKALVDPLDSVPEAEPDTTKSSMWDTWGMTSKEKKSKESKDKVIEPEPEPDLVLDPVVEDDEAAEGGWGQFGSSAKDKKKKEKDSKKKGLLSPTDEMPPKETTKIDEPAKDDIWGSFSAPKTKKGKNSKVTEDPPPPVPTPPAQGLSPEPAIADTAQIDDLDGDPWGGLDSSAPKSTQKGLEKEPIEEKKSSGIWGFGTATKAKTKKEKEKEAKAKQEADEAALKEEEERLQREIEEAEAAEAAKAAEEEEAAAAAAKSSKKTKSTKSARSSGKLVDEKKKSSEDAVTNLLDDEPVATEEKGEDYFGFWGSGSTKKTAGKKDKEITKKGSTNDSEPLAELANDLESPNNDDFVSSSKASKTMPGKSKVGSSIAERIKALEGNKDLKEDSSKTKKTKVVEEPLTKDPITLEKALSPKEEKKASKSKATTKSKNKDDVFLPPSPLPEQNEKKSKESVPGSFPGAFEEEEEDLLGDDHMAKQTELEQDLDFEAKPEPVKPKTKTIKADKKPAKPSKKSKVVSPVEEESIGIVQDLSDPMEKQQPMEDLLDLDTDHQKLPTPPLEEKRSIKKERARVERTGTTASWGFWGAAPPKQKESSRKKLVDEVSPPSSRTEKKASPPLSRSKSSRTPKEKATEDKKETEKASKSSGSDKESKKVERPSKTSRGMSFSQFMLGGPPPSAMRSKSMRQSSSAGGSRPSSRQHSEDGGLASPPPEVDAGMMDKAAKLTGVRGSKPERQRSVKAKSKAYVDPYPIDDDDMVMINTTEVQSPPPTKNSKARPLARRSSTKPRSKTISGDEDVVMVDSAAGENFVTSGPDDHNSPPMRRGNSVRKSTGFFSSFFGGAKTSAEPRVATTDVEDTFLPVRAKSASRRRSKIPDGEDLTTDAPMETDGDVEAGRVQRRAKREANRTAEEEDRAERERRRRERREREEADLEARRARAKERAKKQQEEEAAEKEARRERRRQKEAEKERAAQEEMEINATADRRRAERARLRAELEAANPAGVVSKEERRRSYLVDEKEKQYRKERRQPKDEVSRSKSSALAAEYHDSRSGKGRGTAPPANKTSSWIASQNDEPPELPPISETVLDPSGQRARSVEDFDDGSGSRRRKDKYQGMTEAEVEEHRARRRTRRLEKEKSNSGGSNDRIRSRKEYDAYGDPVRTFDGRPALQRGDSKRSSFIGRFF